MNRKELILLLLGAIVIGGAGLVVFKRNASSWQQTNASPTGANGKALKEFALNDVAQIQIKTSQSELNLVKKEGRWGVKERGDYPANFDQVSGLVRKLWELKAVQEVKAGPSQFGRLNLVEPGSDAKSAGTLIDLKDSNGARIRAVLLGKTFLRESGGEGGGYPAGRYLLPLENPRQPLLVSEPFSQADLPAPQWLDRDFFRIDGVKSVSVTGTSPQSSWKLSRESESGNWKLEDPKDGEELDQAKTSSISSQLGAPSFADVAADSKAAAMNQPTAIDVETFDGFRYAIKLGSSTDANSPLTVSVTANLPKERAAGKDEKPEDKTRLDKQFADKSKELQAKLEKEKKLEPRTFLVARSAFESLLKQRSELMAEKKAPTPTPSPSPAPAAAAAPSEAK